MTLNDAIHSTLQSGFVVESPETGIRIRKIENDHYIIIDGKDKIHLDWIGTFSYFIKCHLSRIKNRDTEKSTNNEE